jgi:hypothetical protein
MGVIVEFLGCSVHVGGHFFSNVVVIITFAFNPSILKEVDEGSMSLSISEIANMHVSVRINQDTGTILLAVKLIYFSLVIKACEIFFPFLETSFHSIQFFHPWSMWEFNFAILLQNLEDARISDHHFLHGCI